MFSLLPGTVLNSSTFDKQTKNISGHRDSLSCQWILLIKEEHGMIEIMTLEEGGE